MAFKTSSADFPTVKLYQSLITTRHVHFDLTGTAINIDFSSLVVESSPASSGTNTESIVNLCAFDLGNVFCEVERAIVGKTGFR